MAFLPDTLINIASVGGGLDIDFSKSPILPDTMERIARAAASSGKRPIIIFRNARILPDTALNVAKLGDGCVVFAY